MSSNFDWMIKYGQMILTSAIVLHPKNPQSETVEVTESSIYGEMFDIIAAPPRWWFVVQLSWEMKFPMAVVTANGIIGG